MLIDPSELLGSSLNTSSFETGRFVGNSYPLESGGDPDLELGESLRIGAGVDPEQGGALLDDERRRNKERDPDK